MTNKQKGFTLTELMLSMAFVSFLLLFLMTSIIHVMRVYNKGVSIRQINQAGRQFNEDFARTAKYGKAGSIIVNTAWQRICVNGVTYAWNLNDPTVTGYSFKNRYISAPSGTPPITMVRVVDASGDLCSQSMANVIPYDKATPVLPVGLNVKKVQVDATRESGRIATLSTVFSTGGANAPLAAATPTGFQCDPSPLGAFCAFADFDTTVYMRN